jgi:hypothetical protein
MNVDVGLPNTTPGADGKLFVEWARRTAPMAKQKSARGRSARSEVVQGETRLCILAVPGFVGKAEALSRKGILGFSR